MFQWMNTSFEVLPKLLDFFQEKQMNAQRVLRVVAAPRGRSCVTFALL